MNCEWILLKFRIQKYIYDTANDKRELPMIVLEITHKIIKYTRLKNYFNFNNTLNFRVLHTFIIIHIKEMNCGSKT